MIYATNHLKVLVLSHFSCCTCVAVCCTWNFICNKLSATMCNKIDYLQQCATICNNLQQIFY